jgi:hypothetical protein
MTQIRVCWAVLFAASLLAGNEIASAQSTAYSEHNVRQFVVGAASTETSVGIPVEVSAQGGGTFDVQSSSANLVVSLVRPDNSEVTAGNASSLGYTLESGNLNISGTALLAGPELMPGFHVRVNVPMSASPGVYRIKVQNTGTSPVLVTVLYRSHSPIRIAAVLPDGQLDVNQELVHGCLVLQSQTRVIGATVSPQVFSFVKVTDGTSNSDFKRVS